MTHAEVSRARGEVTLYIGGVHASQEPLVIKTLLGSCIAVCLHDPVARVGGMNHFMLPYGAGGHAAEGSRFGVHAMDRLIGAVMKVGGDRRRFVAKVFGGAHVLAVRGAQTSVPEQNIEFVRGFLEAEGFPVLNTDVGGEQPRHVHFHTDSGRAFVKRVASPSAHAQLAQRERRSLRTPPAYGDVTLFE
jgi:chemotaxis receptor (MCP) glutamine deamidase CheD